MRARYWLVALAVVGPAARAAEPFADPFFRPAAFDAPAPKPARDPFAATLYDAATAADPHPLPATDLPERAARACADRHPCFRTWLVAEYVLGRTRGPNVSPLVTTGPAAAGALAGAPGQPLTVPLFGGKPLLNDWRSGVRAEAGVWLDRDHTVALAGRFVTLFSAREGASAGPAAGVVNVPQVFAVNGVATQVPVFVSFPGLTAGSVLAGTRTTYTGGDLNVRLLLDRGAAHRAELIAGYRQMYLGDSLTLNFDATGTGQAVALRGRNAVGSRNDFFGPQLGLLCSTGRGPLALEAQAATALGATVADLDFARSFASSGSLSVPATTAALVGQGVPAATAAQLAQQLAAATNQPLSDAATSNTVTYFGVVAEVGVRARWQVTDAVRLNAGYGFVYWNNVRRGPETFVGADAPRARAGDFSTHLFTFGADWRY